MLIGLMPENDIYIIIENPQNELFFIKAWERNEQLRKKSADLCGLELRTFSANSFLIYLLHRGHIDKNSV